MAKLDGKITAARDVPLDLQQLLAAMTPEDGAEEECRREAIARYLAGDEGWREACALLDGAFTCGGPVRDTEKEG